MSLESDLEIYRQDIRKHMLWDENAAIESLSQAADFSAEERNIIAAEGAQLVTDVRETTTPSLMEAFLAEYGLSTKEGLALMCLAEALLRVPDSQTMDALIEDKIMSGEWSHHAGQSISALVNASTMGLQVTSAVLKDGSKAVTKTLKGMVKRMGMPVIRQAVKQVMKELGRQFVLGQDIKAAMKEAAHYEKKGFTYSYDMLGEAAHTAADAKKYFQSYKEAIEKIASACKQGVRENPGISIKISALHPRYEQINKTRVVKELTPKILELAELAKSHNMGFNIDAEEVDRLDISLDLITHVLKSESLRGWDGFGIVVQAYSKRAPFVLEYLYQLASKLDCKIMVRLVKGAYWDAEVKRAQVFGLEGFPVYTRKENTDISYMACAKKLLSMTDRIYPQFASHNAHTVSAVMEFAKNLNKDSFEFQRLHGMGESLHGVLMHNQQTRCRIYAPVGVHRDLLAYLVRRLLENGANSSFVNQIVDHAIHPTEVAQDPLIKAQNPASRVIAMPKDLFGNERLNSKGFDHTDVLQLQSMEEGRGAYLEKVWQVAPLIQDTSLENGAEVTIVNPGIPNDTVATVAHTSETQVQAALKAATEAFPDWSRSSIESRVTALLKAADLYEDHASEIFAILTREAGKSLVDGVAELREAVDFLRYYAVEMRQASNPQKLPRGVITCISPWNFPLAIFTGQIAAALVTGNTVIAKPAEQTTTVAYLAVKLLHQAGIPRDVLQLLPGYGRTIGAAITGNEKISGVCFTGSTATAQLINSVMADSCEPSAPLVAETGGLNAMIVDSTALPEQAVRDIIASSFQSAGQRCSALRMLYVQEDVADRFFSMLYGAMEELSMGNPWEITTDVGPVIDQTAYEGIQSYLAMRTKKGQVVKQLQAPKDGYFIPPTVVKVSGIEELEKEIFGPVLHVATFKAQDFYTVLSSINACGYGLTLGLHTRIDDRISEVQMKATVGNLYINRNQIGAIVGSQPFGGEGLSGTGPKAGGPEYLDVFQKYWSDVGLPEKGRDAAYVTREQLEFALTSVAQKSIGSLADIRSTLAEVTSKELTDWQNSADYALSALKSQVVDAHVMTSPVGETNDLRRVDRGTILCLGLETTAQIQQMITALYLGNRVVLINPSDAVYGRLIGLADQFALEIIKAKTDISLLSKVEGIDAVACVCQDRSKLQDYRKALANRPGKLVPLITDWRSFYNFSRERHCCVDTTASGGDAVLLAGE
ncbi:bifunctional proline dehydrogenase/L-glutamate gamma-semialdehyde dehydrogenase PutA [Temperatibacter marinus]|uniref:Bifunctional protein PutA n=1 Tax=Temperatibacter marinus TaxID=1456591 RepID=A0AA52EDM1_9PROT|nr:bifunctional proline dehydrogenase/L-glutamate gamma-semialdehyde dehydrogenase PutA [Temperatibacter marinus]WND02851.1 bifunctional proline dehydrogenase/L-glutamate gamma-semialdehyde dehydrogenase PutA [Temperatibacter marinus]